jgi:hypothetical protein
MMRSVVVIILVNLFLILAFGFTAQAQDSVQSKPYIATPLDSVPLKPVIPPLDSAQIRALLARLDKKNGFRDVQLGTHLKFFKKIKREWQEEEDYNCRRFTDKLSINGMPLTEIVYGFHKSRLNHIYLTSPGIENSRNLLKFFQSIYGPGELVYEETEEFDNMVQWSGKKVILTYSEVASKKEGFFHFFSADNK